MFSIKQIPIIENKKADALSKIASTSFAHLSKQVLVEELKEKSINKLKVLAVVEEEGNIWMTLIYEYLPEETLPVESCIRQRFASVKHPQANGLVERANRSLGEGIMARLDTRSKNWMEEISHVLWAHYTMIKSSNEVTLFSLTYGTEEVIPAKRGMTTLGTAKVVAGYRCALCRDYLVQLLLSSEHHILTLMMKLGLGIKPMARLIMMSLEPITPLNRSGEGETSYQNNPNTTSTRSVIEGHLSTLKELLKQQSYRDLIKPMLLNFNKDIQNIDDEDRETNKTGHKGKAITVDNDLSRPFKEVLKCHFTRRIIEFSSHGHMMPTGVKIYDGNGDLEDHIIRFTGIKNQGEWPMPVWCCMFQQTLDGKARAWFDKLPPESIDNQGDLLQRFLNRFGMLKACTKDLLEILKIVRKANESLPTFKKRWVRELQKKEMVNHWPSKTIDRKETCMETPAAGQITRHITVIKNIMHRMLLPTALLRISDIQETT
uniref:Reverse transcriptase domain-containing protein n=1 Tax=Tanacetum cinerariifolium TaxID=118510 RepID=A0A6L2NXH8_TANCI|nr:reverse transcriptase domain-containing protein [Tanacetum cinerariifolium]